MVTKGAIPELKTEDPGSGPEIGKLRKILHCLLADNEKLRKEEEMQNWLHDFKAEKLNTLKQTQLEVSGDDEAKLEGRDQAQEDVDAQKKCANQWQQT